MTKQTTTATPTPQRSVLGILYAQKYLPSHRQIAVSANAGATTVINVLKGRSTNRPVCAEIMRQMASNRISARIAAYRTNYEEKQLKSHGIVNLMDEWELLRAEWVRLHPGIEEEAKQPSPSEIYV